MKSAITVLGTLVGAAILIGLAIRFVDAREGDAYRAGWSEGFNGRICEARP